MSIGTRIKELRTGMNLTQEELAKVSMLLKVLSLIMKKKVFQNPK